VNGGDEFIDIGHIRHDGENAGEGRGIAEADPGGQRKHGDDAGPLMGEAKQAERGENPDRRSDQDGRLLGCSDHDRTPDEHAEELRDHDHGHEVGEVVIAVAVQHIVHKIDGHAGDKIHAALAEEVDADEQAEGLTAEDGRRAGERAADTGFDRRVLLLPGAGEGDERTAHKQKTEEQGTLEVELLGDRIADDKGWDETADHGAESRPDHADVGEFCARIVVVHHVRQKTVVRNHQDGGAGGKEAVHQRVEEEHGRGGSRVERHPDEGEGDAGGERADQDVKALGAEP